jgi:hypothetical protein
MKIETETEFEDVLGVLGAFAPVEPPANLEARFRTLAEGQLEAQSPLEVTLEEHGPTALGYLEALLGSQLAAEHALLAACGRLDQDETPGLADLLLYARHAALESLSKTGPTGRSVLSADERALLLERRLGLRLVDLARTWSTMPVRLRERLLLSTEHLLTRSEAANADAPTACAEGRELLIAAPVDLLKPAEAERYAAHRGACAPCAHWSQRLEDSLTIKTFEPSAPWKQLATHRELQAPRGDLGIRVSVSCCYCHDTLQRNAAAFCAACLAPHHTECFEEHSGCSTPGCAGTDLVHPRSVLPGRSRRPSRDAIGRGVLVLALTALGTVAALNATDALRPESATIQTAESASDSTPIPSDIEIGASKRRVLNALGAPEHEESNGAGSVVSWYSSGVRIEFGEDDRLVKASFFGVPESDGAIDANGNKPLFDRSVGWYRAKTWSWRGVEMGMLGPEVIDRLREADRSVPDANGNIFLLYAKSHAVIELHGDRMRYEVVAIHFGGEIGTDSNGNGRVDPIDLTAEFSATEALARALEEADREGTLKAVLKAQGYLLSDSEGKPETLYQVSGARSLDDSGLDFEVVTWALDGLGGKVEQHIQIGWDGALNSYSKRWIKITGEVVYTSTGKRKASGRLELRTKQEFSRTHTQVFNCTDDTVPHHIVLFFLSRLAEHIGPAPWRIRYDDQITHGRGLLRATLPDIDSWEGQFVRTLVVEDAGSGGITPMRLRIATTEHTGLRWGESLNGTGALSPISTKRFQELRPYPFAPDSYRPAEGLEGR